MVTSSTTVFFEVFVIILTAVSMANLLQSVLMSLTLTLVSIFNASHIYITNPENTNQEITMDVFPETNVGDVRYFIIESFWLSDTEIAIQFAGNHLSDHEILADVGVCSEAKILFFVRNKVRLFGSINLDRDRAHFEEYFNISVALGNPNFLGAVISEIKQDLKMKNCPNWNALFEKWDEVIPTMFPHHFKGITTFSARTRILYFESRH